MAFNINEMRSQLVGGGAKSALFQVQITNPVDNVADLKTAFMAKAASLPGSDIGTIEVPYFGRKIKIAGDRAPFPEWSVTIINDEDFLVRNALEKWMSAINGHESNLRNLATSSPLLYKSQAHVTQYSKTGAILREYRFDGIFPTSIAPIDMNWENVDVIEEYTVTFQYDYWDISGGTTGDGGTTT